MKFFVKIYLVIYNFLRICSELLEKSSTENFIFGAVLGNTPFFVNISKILISGYRFLMFQLIQL